MPVNPELLEILVCPETRQPVAQADATLLARLNAEIEAGRLCNRSGAAVAKPIEEGLVREDGKVLYVVDDGIPVMLIEESIELPS
ncbi:MAG TPA: Trm112 family protein [Myxococcota bacterium]